MIVPFKPTALEFIGSLFSPTNNILEATQRAADKGFGAGLGFG